MEKSELKIRYVVLLLTCLLMVGNYFCFDNPAALKTQIQSHFPKLKKEEYEVMYSMLYSVYSIPNIILPFFGGVLVDKLGVRTMLGIFSSIILVGQITFATGCSIQSFSVMLLGRFIFGLGGESLGVAQSTLVVSWFQSRDLAMALGINLSVARLGSVINNIVSPAIASSFSSASVALWTGVLVCVASCVATAIVIPIDRNASSTSNSTSTNTTKKKSSIFSDLRQFSILFWLLTASCVVVYGCVLPFNNVASSLLMERDYFKPLPEECSRCGVGLLVNDTICSSAASDKCPPSPPYAYPLPKLSKNCSTIKTAREQWECSTSRPFIQDSEIDCELGAWKDGPLSFRYCEKKEEAEAAAASPMSVPYLMSAGLSPFLGYAVDKVGKRATLALGAPIVLTLVHLLLAECSMSPWVPLMLQGVAYSVFAAALWPSVPYLVKAEQVGSAYGTITSVQNIGLATFPMLVASVYDLHDRYIPEVELLFASFGVCGSVIGLLIYIIDKKYYESVLNLPTTTSAKTCDDDEPLLE